MKRRISSFRTPILLTPAILVAALVFAADTPAPEKVWLQSPTVSDLISRLLAPPGMVPRANKKKAEEDRSAESSSRRLGADELWRNAAMPGSVATTSRGYRLELQPARLRVGTPFFTAQAGALMAFEGLSAEDLEIQAGDRVLPGVDAFEAVPKGGVSKLPADRTPWRLRQELGAGRFTVRGSSAPEAGPLALFVEEPESSIVLYLTLQRSHYVHGQLLLGSLHLAQRTAAGDIPLSTLRAEATLTLPGEVVQPVRLVQDAQGRYHLRFPLDARNNSWGEDWQLRVEAAGMIDGQQVVRDANTSFRVAMASARLLEPALVTRGSARGLTIALPVEASVPGRFAVSGVLYSAGSDPRPLAEARSAAWLDAGKGSLALVFGPELFPEGLPEGPLEMRSLLLEDLSREGVIQSQEVAFVIE